MVVERGWKPGASDRERSSREHGKWVSRPPGFRARDLRGREKAAWRKDQARDSR